MTDPLLPTTVGEELTLLVVVLAALFLPGSAILILTRTWRPWSGLQRIFLSLGLGMVFYPVLFYALGTLPSWLGLNRWVLIGLLLAALLVNVWAHLKERVWAFRPDRLEWAALLVLGLTLASRVWFAHAHPYPAWSDSLHHTILTELVAESGRLPRTMEPYYPNTLEMYHLGLYSLSGTVQLMAGSTAHAALQWTAQVLNALCGIGIYLALDRRVGRAGAIVGLALAGLFSSHPALWGNWGRFTQLSGVVVLPVAWLLWLEWVSPGRRAEEPADRRTGQLWPLLLAAATSAGVFMFHFRVGVFHFMLLGLTTLAALLQVERSREAWWRTLRPVLLAGLGIAIFVAPVLWQALDAYLAARLVQVVEIDPAVAEEVRRNYYTFPWRSIPYLAAPVWLLALASLGALVGLTRRNLFILVQAGWALLMISLGFLYLLGIPVLNFTNLGAVLIMLYIPLGLVIGAAVEIGLAWLPRRDLGPARAVLLGAIAVAGVQGAVDRATTVEGYRHFVTEQDIRVMAWIDKNLPEESTFAINLYNWLPQVHHGTDAGYWIPYFTGRETVTTAMLNIGLSDEYLAGIDERSVAAEALEADLGSLGRLYDLGVEYIYIGANGDFSGPGLQLDFLEQSDRVELLFQDDGAAVLQILAP